MRITAFLAAALLIPNTAFSTLIDIGAAGAITGKVVAKAPEGNVSDRPLSSGKTIYHKDSVTTDAKGHAQVLLLDETVFTIGANSNIVLDEFVYDPFTGAGKVTASVTKGVLRFVTGKVGRKDPSTMNIKLPSGTLGIRGTIAAVQTDGVTTTVGLLGPGSGNNADERPGAIWVENAGEQVYISRPGFGTIIEGPGMPPSPAFELSPDQLASLNAALVRPGSDLRDSPNSGGGAGSSDKDSAGKAAGQETAEGKGGLANTLSLANFGGLLDAANEDLFESVPGIDNNALQWDEVRTRESGTGHYAGIGGYTGSGGTTSGAIDFSIDIDFGVKTVGGGSSYISLSDSGQFSDTTNVPTVDFSALEGDASFALGSATEEYNTAFNGTTVSLLSGVSTADTMRVDLVYDDSYGTTASGAAIGGLEEGLTAGYGKFVN